MDKKTLELILNAVFDGAELALAGKPVLLGIVKVARPIILSLVGKLVKGVDASLKASGLAVAKAK